MAALPAEVRHVDHRGGIGRTEPQHLAKSHSAQRLARAEHGERAEKPLGIDVAVEVHGQAVGRVFHFVHRLVTTRGVTLAAAPAIWVGT